MYHIFHGEDSFSAGEALTALKADFGDAAMLDLNTTELHGKDLTPGELQHHIQAIPFLAPVRLVIVHDYLGRLTNKSDKPTLTALGNALTNMPPSTQLIFLENKPLNKAHPIVKQAEKTGQSIRTFSLPSEDELPAWVNTRVKHNGGKIERAAAQQLAQVVGPELRWLDNEIDKLLNYTNRTRAVTLADVQLLCPYLPAPERFGLSNAIADKKTQNALDQCYKLQHDGEKKLHPLAIIGMLTSQFRSLIQVQQLIEQRMPSAEIAKAVDLSSGALFHRQRTAKKFGLARLQQIFNILLETDLAIKTGKQEADAALDMLIVRLCS